MSAIQTEIPLAEHLSSTRSVDRIRDLTRLMKPHAKLPSSTRFLAAGKGVARLSQLCGGQGPGLLDFEDFLGCGWSG